MNKIAKIISYLFLTSVTHATEEEFIKYTNTYKKYLNNHHGEIKASTPQEAWKQIGNIVNDIQGGVYHKDGRFGASFFGRNIFSANYVIELLAGQKKWSENYIRSHTIRLADIGCGLGLSATYLVSEVIKYYEQKEWTLKYPIEFDLYDVNQTHQEALTALSNLINLAYPQYFTVKMYTHDIRTSLERSTHYNILFALSLMHFIPSKDWDSVRINMSHVLKRNGFVFLTTDNWQAFKSNLTKDQVQRLRRASKRNPFFCPSLTIYNPLSDVNKGTHLMNFDGMNFLNNEEPHVPSEIYDIDTIDLSIFEKMLEIHMKSYGKQTMGLYDQVTNKKEEVSKTDIIEKFKNKELTLYAGNYIFDQNKLRKIIQGKNVDFKTLTLSWEKESSKYQASLTLQKK